MKSVAVKSSPAKTKAKPASVKARPAKTAAAKPAAKRVVAKAPAKKAVVSRAAPAKAKQAGAKAPVKAKVKAAAPVKVKAKAPAGKAAAPKSAPVKAAPAKTAAPKKTAPVKVAVAAPKKAALSPKPAAPLPKSLPRPLAAAPVAHVAVRKNPRLANNWKTKPVEQWSDAEVIAMPDDEYMNEPQRAFFRLKLLALRNGILDNAGQTAENLRDDTAVVPDPADRATIEEEHALELRTRDRERKLLKKIEQSIARIDSGDYGYCDETGEPIGVPRLLARPTATLSLEAQQRRELKQKMFGD